MSVKLKIIDNILPSLTMLQSKYSFKSVSQGQCLGNMVQSNVTVLKLLFPVMKYPITFTVTVFTYSTEIITLLIYTVHTPLLNKYYTIQNQSQIYMIQTHINMRGAIPGAAV